VISSTTAPNTVIDKALVEDAMEGREHSLFIIDIAVPRDVESEVGLIEGVVLRDIEDLRSVVETNVGGRVAEIAKVEEIIAGEVQRFMAWQHQTEFAPTVAQLVERADRIRETELARMRKRVGELSDADLDTIDHLTRRIIAKLLHVPISRVKELASSKQGYVYLDALRELFELDDDESS
jgi:glutamyl-tRNA reductase